jgi:hypothetical protein
LQDSLTERFSKAYREQSRAGPPADRGIAPEAFFRKIQGQNTEEQQADQERLLKMGWWKERKVFFSRS